MSNLLPNSGNNDPKRQSDIANIINHGDNDNSSKRQKLTKAESAASLLEMKLSETINNQNLISKQVKTENQTTLHHRPVTSCTHCRQHKIKCDANQKYPQPCTRCKKFDLYCEVDPRFTPKKGSQMQIMRKDIDELKVKVNRLLSNEALLLDLLKVNSEDKSILSQIDTPQATTAQIQGSNAALHRLNEQSNHMDLPKLSGNEQFSKVPIYNTLSKDSSKTTSENVSPTGSNEQIRPTKQLSLSPMNGNEVSKNGSALTSIVTNSANKSPAHATVTTTLPPIPSPFTSELDSINEFIIGDIHLSLEKANQLHSVFVKDYLPYLPIMFTKSVAELYSQSRLLFWTVMSTACLSDPEPSLYIKLSPLLKQLAIERCWLQTPRSTHISQALIILSIWPLPNQKVLDDCSYRFVNLAKSLSYQLGLHRGEFIYEFTRNQTLMPNAKKWRTRTWLGIFFSEICWSTILGLPPTSQTDYLVEIAKTAEEMDEKDFERDIMNNINDDYDNSKPYTFKLPSRFKKLICLASFQMKLCNVMGSSVISSDGLIEPKDRAGSLAVLERELEVINKNLKFESDIVVHIYYLYVRLNVCCFAFLPHTPIEDQAQYVTKAYLCATKCITLVSKLLEERPLISLPIYIRQSITFSGLILFKLQLNPLIINKYLNSARQSIVTVHRLFRNQLSAWAAVENDISRTASMLEKSNMILITHPEVFTDGVGIISRIRSHLTGSLFYDFVWCVHEARRREMDPNCNHSKDNEKKIRMKLYPLPLYNQILKEDFQTVTQTTPNGTTVTTLIPTQDALKHAEEVAKTKTDKEHSVMTINGIPLSMLDETGSVKNYESLFQRNGIDWSETSMSSPASTVASYSASSVGNERNDSIHGHSMGNMPPGRDGVPYGSNPLSPMAHSLNRMRNPKSLFGPSERPSPIMSTTTPGIVSGPSPSPHRKSSASFSQAKTMANDLQLYNSQHDTMGQDMTTEQLNRDGSIQTHTGEAADSSKRKKKNKRLNPEEALEASYLNDFFQQQSLGWTEGNLNTDDLFGWFDNVNMQPEF